MKTTMKSIFVAGVLCAFFTAQASETPPGVTSASESSSTPNHFFAKLIAAGQQATPEKTEHLRFLYDYWLKVKDDQPAAHCDNKIDPSLAKLKHRLTKLKEAEQSTRKHRYEELPAKLAKINTQSPSEETDTQLEQMAEPFRNANTSLQKLKKAQTRYRFWHDKALINSGLPATSSIETLPVPGVLGLSKLSTPPGFHEFMKGEGAVPPQRGAKDSAKKRSSPSTPHQPKKKKTVAATISQQNHLI